MRTETCLEQTLELQQEQLLEQTLELQQEQLPEVTIDLVRRANIQKAKATILAAKYAYVAEKSLWLSLLDKATMRIEQCPEDIRPQLTHRLHSFHSRTTSVLP